MMGSVRSIHSACVFSQIVVSWKRRGRVSTCRRIVHSQSFFYILQMLNFYVQGLCHRIWCVLIFTKDFQSERILRRTGVTPCASRDKGVKVQGVIKDPWRHGSRGRRSRRQACTSYERPTGRPRRCRTSRRPATHGRCRKKALEDP